MVPQKNHNYMVPQKFGIFYGGEIFFGQKKYFKHLTVRKNILNGFVLI